MALSQCLCRSGSVATLTSAQCHRKLPSLRSHTGLRRLARCASSNQPTQDTQAQTAESLSSSDAADSGVEALESQIRGGRRKRRAGKIEPKVKVNAPAVDELKGTGPASPTAKTEEFLVTTLGLLFGLILLEGLILAGSGFLPEDWDNFVRDVLYPSYTPTVLGFLGFSSFYGLWKTGKLPGQQQLK